MTLPAHYTPKFQRHLHHLIINGFFARDLDADDHAFLEAVRVRGSANSELPGRSAAFGEEAEFWNLPYVIEPGVHRRVGPVPMRQIETPEQQKARLARSTAWRARRTIREYDKAVAAAELERERRAWELANANRKLREVLADAEWEAADPGKLKLAQPHHFAPFGATLDRHHVPQWKLDETQEVERRERKAEKKELARKRREADRARAELRRIEREQRTEQRTEHFERLHFDALKFAIATLFRSAPGQRWTVEQIGRAVGQYDETVLNECLAVMCREGLLIFE